jgi:hypothetical protein
MNSVNRGREAFAVCVEQLSILRWRDCTREKFSLQTREGFGVLIILGYQTACFHVLIYWLCKKKSLKK